jgi:D-proline reductase (dithiol) PrdB
MVAAVEGFPKGLRHTVQCAKPSLMARPEDISQPTRDVVLNLPCPSFDTTPFVSGPPLSQRRIAILSSAALVKRGDPPFPFGSGECRFIPANTPTGDLLMTHVSINHDRTGWQRDVNVVFPIDRLKEMAAAGEIGGVAPTHYAVMGSTHPDEMAASVAQIAGQLRQERIDSILLSPV